jgi:hypothetical protein
MHLDAVAGALEDLGEGPVHAVGVPDRQQLSIYMAGHGGMEHLAPGRGLEHQLVLRDQPGAEAGGEVLALAGAQGELHLLHLEHAGAPVVHHHVAEDGGVGFGQGGVPQRSPGDDGDLQLEVQAGEVVVLHLHLAGAGDGQVVGEVGDGEQVELGDHLQPAVAAGRGHVLAEGVAVAHGDGPGHGGQQAEVAGIEEGGGRRRGGQAAGQGHQLVLAPDEGEHVHGQAGVGRGEVEDAALVLDGANLLLVLVEECHELHGRAPAKVLQCTDN